MACAATPARHALPASAGRAPLGRMSESSVLPVGATCRPNFSAAGRRRRTRIAVVLGIVTLATLAGVVVAGAAWAVRLVVGLPAAATLVTALQVTRHTCVAHAATGSIEGEDFSLAAADAAHAAASRRVARTIWRDALVGGALVAALAAATSLLG